MLKSNGKLRDGICLQLSPEIELVLFKRVDAHWLCACSDNRSASEILQEVGTTPIPPYIVRARCGDTVQDAIDRKQYQTIFADASQCESVAAPTAGLHFDEKLLAELEQEGFERVPVTLHVGAGTFKGIETDEIADHQMHFEKWSVSQSSLDSIKRAKEEGRPIIAVGTTSVRTLESLPPMAEWPDEDGLRGSTDLMIVPPYAFSLVDGLVTNFHLPKSTLLTLVAAKVGIDKLHQVYEHAISFDYRFYSFGDAMFILP
jgi:S-adenosylmethionine:tRNA ribosyltransferase-isomerase